MLHSKYLFPTFFLITLFILSVALIVTNSIQNPIESKNTPTTETQDAMTGFSGSQESSADFAGTTGTPSSFLPPGKVDQILLEEHCSQCHIIQWLEQIEKSREEWESTLIQMEKLGVSLSEAERIMLINNLTDTDKH